MPTNYGLPNGGNVNTFSPEWLQSMYPYVTFGPQMAQQLANLQFGAGLDAQSQNNQMAMQLAQGAASNRFADNIASKLALNGMGAFPGAGSAFGQGNWGVQQVRPPNIMDIFQQMNSGLGNIFGTAQQAGGAPVQSGGFGQQNPATGNSGGNIGGLPTPTPFGPSGATPGNTMGWTSVDALGAIRSGNQPLADYMQQVIIGKLPYDPSRFAALGGAPAATTQPRQTSDFVDWSSGSPTIGGRPIGGFGTPRPGGKQNYDRPQNPFAPLHQLAFGQGGFGPDYFTSQMLGTGSPGFGAPRTNLTGYYSASPDQRQAQDYFMQSQAGYSPQQLAYERQAFTPGARMGGFGF